MTPHNTSHRSSSSNSRWLSISCRLIEGRYPNYNSVIPQSNPNQARVERAAMLAALKRVINFSLARQQEEHRRYYAGKEKLVEA